MNEKRLENIKNMTECIQYVNDMKYCFDENHKNNILVQCKQKFNIYNSYNSSENNNICFSDNTFGGNTLKETIKSPATSGDLVKPFPLIIFSSRF